MEQNENSSDSPTADESPKNPEIKDPKPKDPEFQDLNYGYTGPVTYDINSSEWAFVRQFTTKRLRQIRTWNGTDHVDTCMIAPNQLPHPRTPVNSTITHKDVLNQIQKHPELAPAAAILPELAPVSAAISATTSTYDPFIGNLLSFGSITLEGRHETPRQVAAFPVGEAKNVLQLTLLNKEMLGWGMTRKTRIEGSTLQEAESGYWNEEAAPIRQICFSQSEDRSSLLAVRLPTRTVFFHPIRFRQARAAAPSPFYNLAPSVIDAHPIFSMKGGTMGDSPHSDVAFNPGFQLQFALAHQGLGWSVWDIEHSRKSDVYKPSQLASGYILGAETDSLAGEDEWARILWVADVTTLLVCNRRHMRIFSLKRMDYLFCPKLLSEASAEWFLDVKQHPKNMNWVFVLTSTRLILVLVKGVGEDDASVDDAGATVLTSWKHYRSAEDFTLQMSVQILSDDDPCVALYSQINNIIQLFTFKPLSGAPFAMACSDPDMLDLTIDEPGQITGLHMEPMRQQGIEIDLDFFRLFISLSSSSIHEFVFCAKKSSAQESLDASQVVEDFTQSIIKRPRIGIPKEETIEDGFIVPDGLIVAEPPRSKIPSEFLKRDQNFGRTSILKTWNNELLYEALQLPENTMGDAPSFISVTTVTDEVKQMLISDPDSVSLPMGTLMEYVGLKLDVPDVDEVSSNLQHLLSENEENALYAERIASARTLDLTEDGDPTVSDVYDTILQTWVAPLPPAVPSRVRQAKERLARRAAAEVMFSSIRVREHVPDEPIPGTHFISSQDRSMALPILPSRPRNVDFYSAPPSAFSQILPTPPPSVPSSSLPPSSLPASSPPDMPLAPNAPSDPLVRLGRHLHNRHSYNDPVSIRANASQVLRHWQIGGDPRNYDWAATERALEPEHMDEESQRQRERERKKQKRNEKRQQREDEQARAKGANQAAVFARSSPGPMLGGGLGSSSHIPTQSQSQMPVSSGGFVIPIPQSQVEPGKFGGRLDKKKKKKGRMSGF